MFVAHPTVRLKGSEHVWQPVICSDKNCENRDRKNHMHCPLCQSASCSTDLAYMKMHFRVKHVDEGLDYKTGFYSLKCYRHCKIVNWRKEKLLKTPHWHCFKCRNAFKRKDDLIVHYQSHRVHKNNSKVITTHVAVQKDINQGILIEKNRKNYQTLARIQPCPAKAPECLQPKIGDGHLPIFPKSYINNAITQPTAVVGEIKLTNQSSAIINNNVGYSFTEEQITEDMEMQIVDTRSEDVVHHSEAVATIIDSDSPLNPENHFLLLKKDRRISLPKDSNVTSQKESCIPSENDMPVPRKEVLHKTSQSLLSQNGSPHSPSGQRVISLSDQSSALRGRFLPTQVGKLQAPSNDTHQPLANAKCSSPLVNQCLTAHNGQIRSSQNDRSMPSQNDEHLSSNNDHSPFQMTDQGLPSEKDSSLPSRKDQYLPPKEKENLPSQRDEFSSLPNVDCAHCKDGHYQSPRKDRCPSLDKSEDHSHEDCINEKTILLEEKKQLEKGLETAKKEKNEMTDTIRGMTDAISQLREENKEMSQKLSKLAEENAALRRQLKVITSAIFSPESSKSSPSSKKSSAAKDKSKSPAFNKTILVTSQPVYSVSKETPRRGSHQVISRPVVRMKSILPPVTAEEQNIHQALIGPELQASLGRKVTKVTNATGDKSPGREDTSKPSRLQNVLNLEQNQTKDKSSETTAIFNPSRNESGISSRDVQLDSSSKSLHDILEETFNGTISEHLESQDVEEIGADTAKSTGVSEQSGDSLLSEVFEAELETQILGLHSFEMEQELLISSGCSSAISSTTASSTDNSIEGFDYVSKNHVVSQKESKLSTMGQCESMFDQREDSSSPEFIESTESLLEMFEASLNGEQGLGSIEQFTSPPTAGASESETDRVASSLVSSILMSTSENDNQLRENISQERVRFGDTTTEPSLVSPSLEVSPQKDFEMNFFGSNENLSKQRSLSDVLHLDESFDLSQVSDEFSILDRCFDSDLGENNLSGYSVCPLSALLDDDNFLLNVAYEEDEPNRGRKRCLDTDDTRRPKKK